MPLQWLPLDQSIYKEAINSQQPSRGQTPSRQFLGTQDTTNYALERMKADNAIRDKKRKEEEKAAMEKAQDIGLRIMQAQAKEKQQYQQMAQQKQQQQVQQMKQIEENPEPAAKEMFQFMQTVDDETRNRLLEQLFTPIKTGSITMGGKTMETPSRYNPIAQQFIEKGWVTFNPKTGEPEFSMPQREFEKGTYELVDLGGKLYRHNTTDGTYDLIGSKDKPELTIAELDNKANEEARNRVELEEGDGEDFSSHKYDVLVDLGVDEETARSWAKVEKIDPEKEKGTWDKIKDWFSQFAPPSDKERSKMWQEASGTSKTTTQKQTPKYREEAVSALMPLIETLDGQISDAQRQHWVSQGVTNEDINEALRRRGE